MLLFLGSASHAALKALTDDELSYSTGQAFLQIDRTSQGSTDFTKFTFGMDVDVSLNSDLIELGRYDRDLNENGKIDPGEVNNGSDIRINDFALGSINDDGTINPFNIKDPFFELAFEEVNGKEELVGVRLGFGEALGKLSGNIEYLTGNIEVDVVGRAEPIRDAANGCLVQIIFCITTERQALSIAGINDDTRLRADAELVNAFGDPEQIRAQLVGLKNGDRLNCVSGCSLGGLSNFLLGLFESGNCEVLSLSTCFPLANFRSLDIGQPGSPASGLFLSFQNKDVTWYDDGKPTPTPYGAFMNIPNGGIQVDFEQSFNGIERVRTKMLDPYYD